MSEGRVRNSDPFSILPKSIGGTSPDALPKLTIMPNGRRHSIDRSNVSLPTEAYTTGPPGGREPLACDQPDAPGRRVPHDGIARLDLVGAFDQVPHGHTLQHHRRSPLEGDPVWQVHEAVGRHRTQLAVGAHG